MKRSCLLLVLILMIAATPVVAYYCNGPFHIMFIDQSIRAGGDLDNLPVVQENRIWPDLFGLEFLHDSTEYKIVSEFSGNCDSIPLGQIEFKVRPKTTPAFLPVMEDYYVDLSSGTLAGTNWEAWFDLGTNKTGDSIHAIYNIGTEALGQPFYHWYATATLLDSARDGTGKWQTTTFWYGGLTSYVDSATLGNYLLGTWKQNDYNGVDKRAYCVVQFLKVHFDTVNASVMPFRHSQHGGSQLLFEVPGSLLPLVVTGLGTGESQKAVLPIYSLDGSRVAAAIRGGHSFRFNGRDMQENALPAGIYVLGVGRAGGYRFLLMR